MAKSLLSEDYRLIDLRSMADDEIKQKRHIGMLHYFLKHIYDRDMMKLWQQFLETFKQEVLIDRENGYIYIKNFLWYTDTKVPADKKGELNRLILDYLPNNEGEEVMRTIADSYIEEGIEKGIVKGIEKGIEEGIEEGIEKGIIRTAINMFREKLDLNLISTVTGLSKEQLLKLKNKHPTPD